MGVEYANDLLSWMSSRKITTEDEKAFIEDTLKAFSEYITAVDQEYQYNKSFLNNFIPEFFVSLEMLAKKKKFLNELIEELEDYKGQIKIKVDDAWIFGEEKSGEEIKLTNRFSISKVNSGKINYQIRYVGEPSFVIAREAKLEKTEKELKEVVELFNSRIKDDEKK